MNTHTISSLNTPARNPDDWFQVWVPATKFTQGYRMSPCMTIPSKSVPIDVLTDNEIPEATHWRRMPDGP